jgi:uncharacterized LabA/DUF88 family protein
MICNTAVFYDIENLICLFAVKYNTILHLDEIHRRILDVDGVNGVSIQRAYADWAVQANRNLRQYVLQIGIEPVQIFNTNPNDRVKNAADVSLIIDAVELLTRRPEIENYAIVSGDGIFAFLAKKLHEYGKRVIGCGFDRNTNAIFHNACDVFVNLEKSDKTLTAVIKKQKPVTQAQTAPVADEIPVESPAEVPAVKPAAKPAAKTSTPKIPRRFPRGKFSDALDRVDIPVWTNNGNPNDALITVRDLVNALFANVGDEAAELEVSVFKIYVDYYVPGFKISQYKFKRFGEFVRFILTNSPFCLYAEEETILRIARRGVEGISGNAMPDMTGVKIIQSSDGAIVKSLFNLPADAAFTYEIVNAVKIPQKRGPKPRAAAQTAEPAVMPVIVLDKTKSIPDNQNDTTDDDYSDGDEGSVRKWIKSQFMRLSLENALTAGEVRRLLTAEYSQKAFGIKTPILKESLTRSNLREQRLVNGKIKYWKEQFKFNGKTYLIYKEWIAALHRERFIVWVSKQGVKPAKTSDMAIN